jgi:hypothetical protein
VRVNVTADLVDGYATPNHAVSASLVRGGSTLATAATVSDLNGFFSVFFTNASGVVIDIQAGDVVNVTASPTNSITVAALTASLNTATGVVSGAAPANSVLYVEVFHWSGTWYNSDHKTVTSNGSGNYSADFSSQMSFGPDDYAYVRYTDANGNRTGVNTIPSNMPLKTQSDQELMSTGAKVKVSTVGYGNNGDLTAPLLYNHPGGKATFTSRNGGLYITAPNGTVYDVDNDFFTINNAAPGIWKVQVHVWWWSSNTGEGEQYAISAGNAAYTLYLPILRR